MTNAERQIDHIHKITQPKINAKGTGLTNSLIYYKKSKRYQKYFSGKTIEILEEKIEKFITETFMNELILLSPAIHYENFAKVWIHRIKKNKVKPQTLFRTINIFQQYIFPLLVIYPYAMLRTATFKI